MGASQSIRDRATSIMPDGDAFPLPESIIHAMGRAGQLKESPSSIVQYLECPLKWAVVRYGGLPRDDAEQHNPWSVLGTFVHRVLEIFYNERRELRTEELLKDIRRSCLAEIENGGTVSGLVSQREQEAYGWVFDTYEDGEEPPHWIGHGDSKFAFYQWFRDQSRNLIMGVYDIEDPEDVHVVTTEKWARKTVNRVIINMRLDRETQSEGGQLVIDDWKTGRAPSQDEEIEVTNATFLPAAIYGVSDKSSGYSDVNRVRLLYLKDGEAIVLKMTDERRELTQEILNQVTQGMTWARDNGEVLATPASKPSKGVCRLCPINDLCPAWSGEDDPWSELTEYIEAGGRK